MSLGWEYKKLSKLCTFDKERIGPLDDVQYYHYSFPAFDNNKEPEIEMGEDIKSSKFVFKKGDILFNILNVKFKRVWNIDFDLKDNSICSTEFIPIQSKCIDQDFLYYSLISPKFTNEMKYLSTGTSNSHQRINPKDLKDYDLYLPKSEDIQMKIGYILKLLDKKISVNLEINKNLIAIAKAKFRHSFIKYEDYDGEFKDTDYGIIPETFEVYTLNEISNDIVCGKTPSTKVESNYGDEMPFITIPDMHNNVFVITTERRLSSEGIKTQPKKTLPENSVCVSCIATAGLVSLTFEESQTNQQINSIVCNDNICPYFMYLYMEELSEYIKLLGSGGSTTLNLNKNEFSKIKVAIPPQKDMDKFHNLIKPIFEKIKYNQVEIIELQKLRDTLLPKLMSGEIDVSKINCDMPPKTQENCINNFTSLQQNKLVEVII